MAVIYDFNTRKPIANSDVAKFEILSWDDPIVRNMVHEGERVLVDGLVPAAIALEMKALCDRYNAQIASSYRH